MGGNALKGNFTRRYTDGELQKRTPILLDKIANVFNTKTATFPSYSTKETHGDLDVLVYNDGTLPQNISQLVLDYLVELPSGLSETELLEIKNDNSYLLYKNDNIYSYLADDLQVDLIFTPTHNWNTSNVFFAYNDLGNLMGKIAYKLGLSYGFEGLKYKSYSEGKKKLYGQIPISKDMPKIFEFLGFSYERWEQGFKTLDDIFVYVIESKYFHPDIFLLKEEMTYKNRKRNRKRKVFQEFITLIADMQNNGDFDKRNFYKFAEHKDEYLPSINNIFPSAEIFNKIQLFKDVEAKQLVVKSKFNGGLLNTKFNVPLDKNMGKVIQMLKSSKTDWSEWVYNTDQNVIDEHIITLLNNE